MSRGALKPSGDLRWRHGHSRTPTYYSWINMLTRCTNERNSHYGFYGARGISVCDRWKTFSDFLADMGEKPKGMSLDRIDNDGNYEPGNCRWATHRTQSRNRRSTKAVIRSDGRRYSSMAEAAEDVSGTVGGIWSACTGDTHSHRGFKWRYAT